MRVRGRGEPSGEYRLLVSDSYAYFAFFFASFGAVIPAPSFGAKGS